MSKSPLYVVVDGDVMSPHDVAEDDARVNDRLHSFKLRNTYLKMACDVAAKAGSCSGLVVKSAFENNFSKGARALNAARRNQNKAKGSIQRACEVCPLRKECQFKSSVVTALGASGVTGIVVRDNRQALRDAVKQNPYDQFACGELVKNPKKIR